jgi:hypothetical protein
MVVFGLAFILEPVSHAVTFVRSAAISLVIFYLEGNVDQINIGSISVFGAIAQML